MGTPEPGTGSCSAQIRRRISVSSLLEDTDSENMLDCSQFACESFHNAEESIIHTSPGNASQTCRRAQPVANNSSNIVSSMAASASYTPLRNTTGSRGKAVVTPNLDHVLSFHQKVSPSIFHPNALSSFTLDTDSPSPRDSRYSYFQNWSFYSPNSGREAVDNFPPDSSDEVLSTSDSDSSSLECSRQIIFLSKPNALLPATTSVPQLCHCSPEDDLFSPLEARTCPVGRRIKSLSALSTHHTDERKAIGYLKSSVGEVAYKNRPLEMVARSLCCTPEDLDSGDSTSLTAFELVDSSLSNSAQNSIQSFAGQKIIGKPFKCLKKVVSRIIA